MSERNRRTTHDAAGRIDALRTAIDAAVGALNEAWSGFGPSEVLEAIISDLQRAQTNDDIAQGRDWPPVVLAEAANRAAEPLDVEQLRQVAVDAFDAVTEQVEPWASGPVKAKHRGLFAAEYARLAALERER